MATSGKQDFLARIGVVLWVWITFCAFGTKGQLNLSLLGIERWSQMFGQTIYDICSKATAITDIRTDYMLMDPRVRNVDGEKLIKEIKEKMAEMLTLKINAVQRLVEVAEKAHAEHIYDKDIAISYGSIMAKKLNTSEFLLQENERFNNIEVNLTMSTVHVPTNVYDQSPAVVNGITWSEALDDAFRKNLADDPTSKWQYFCSATGFMRNFPGTIWRTDTYVGDKSIDVFDCRVRRWYIQSAAYPKDVVILLDSSGSMKGLRIEIAKATVMKILDTLGDDDFFNVIKYSDRIEYVDSCFNATMVQASESNKESVKKSLSSTRTQNIAYLDLALNEAFELLQATNDSGRGSLCNKAIMIVTDGATETYEEIFEKYNSPTINVRVFTYLIGREVGDSRNVLWMACRNKGRFSHITSLADVHEHVQSYVHVLSRPLVISRARLPVWTNVYLDTLVPGLELMTTIAQPVFDTKNDTTDRGILLGVAGSDVPLKELAKITPPYKVGVNGYSFAITNNGYILFHPRCKPILDFNERRSIDLSEVELLHNNTLLRNRMIDRETGYARGEAIFPYDQSKRAKMRTSHYFFTDIKDTPFSLGISLPHGYGMSVIETTRPYPTIDLSALRTGDLIIAPWEYCKIDAKEAKQNSLEMLIKYLTITNRKGAIQSNHCDKELINHLLFDAEATRGALASWMKENHDGTLNDSTSKRSGIEIVFIGTKGGLTRFFRLTDNLTDPDFLQRHNSTIEEVYYMRAVENGEATLTISIPFNPGKLNMNESVLTVTTPIVISGDGSETVAAVVGLQMKYSKFYEVFTNISRTCPVPEMDCNITCDSEEINCYLVDENGYVIVSKNPNDAGQFFGELEGNGALMTELIIDEDERREKGYTSRGVFERLEMLDYQAICDIYSSVGQGASSVFSSPLARLLSALWWIFNELILFFLQFGFVDWWQGTTSVEGSAKKGSVTSSYDVLTSTDYVDQPMDYGHMYDDINQSRKGVREAMMECASILDDLLPKAERKRKVKECFDNVRSKHSPRLIGWRPCVKLHTYYTADTAVLPQYGVVMRCANSEKCANSYSVNQVPRTNLILIVVDATCTCPNEPLVRLDAVEVLFNDSYICEKLQHEVFRRRPEHCHAYHKDENHTDCGLCNLLQPSVAALLVSLLLTFFAVSH